MPTLDPRVDAYIANAQPFAQPLLRHLRQQVHAAIPEVRETMKWGMPHFCGRATIAHMAAFKGHCAFGFWLSRLIPGLEHVANAMSQLGRIASAEDLPDDAALAGWLRAAAELDRQGVKDPARSRSTAVPRPVEVPAALAAALAADAAALARWEALAPSHRREYAEWVAEAKREATRERRVAQAVEWIALGRSRNWKYEGGGK